MKRNIDLYLEDVLKSIQTIEEFTKNTDRNKFLKDKLKQRAVERELEIIGETIKFIPTTLKKEYPKIPWRNIAGLRDVLIHAYFGIIPERIWGVIKKDLPALKKQIKNIKIEKTTKPDKEFYKKS